MCVSNGLISPSVTFSSKLRGYEQKRQQPTLRVGAWPVRVGKHAHGHRPEVGRRSRFQTPVQAGTDAQQWSGELVQRKITFLSGETCIAVMRGGVAPTSQP